MENQQKEKIIFLSPPSEYAMADEWHEIATEDHFWMKWRFNALKKILPREYVWGEALDIGSGNGVARQQIEEHYDCRVSACDLSMRALEQLKCGRGQLYFYNINQKNTEFHERFQTILLLDVLEHIKESALFLDAVSFHLKPSGKIIINVPAFQFLSSGYDRVVGHVRRYTVSMLRKELRQAGFVLEDSLYWGACLVPFLLMRKCIMPFCKDAQVVKCGFQPPSRAINSLFLLLMKTELAVGFRPLVGTSLMALVSKAK